MTFFSWMKFWYLELMIDQMWHFSHEVLSTLWKKILAHIWKSDEIWDSHEWSFSWSFLYKNTHYSQDSLDQCPMLIIILALIPMSINSDQCRSIPNVLLMPWSGIDRHWEELVGNDRHWETFRINSMILIGIDRHWALIGGVLYSAEFFFVSDLLTSIP